jgi:hypothetical protein
MRGGKCNNGNEINFLLCLEAIHSKMSWFFFSLSREKKKIVLFIDIENMKVGI